MADEVQFTAQVGKWVCVKKQKVPDGAKIEVSRALASIHDSMDRKIWEFLGEEFDLEALDKIAYEVAGAEFDEKKKKWLVKGRVSEQQIINALAKLKSPALTRSADISTKNGKAIAKAYVTRKVLDILGFQIELNPKTVEKYLEEKSKLL
jgi:hypothetical protein